MLAQFGLVTERKFVKAYVVPLPSDLWTAVIRLGGRFKPGFSAAMAGSFHFVIVPMYMPAMTSEVNCSVVLLGIPKAARL